MNKTFASYYRGITGKRSGSLQQSKNLPASTSEKLVKEEVNRLNESIEQIKKLGREIEKKHK